MNQAELERILKQARLPETPGESLEMFPRRVAARLNRTVQRPGSARSLQPRLAWAFGLAACVVIALAIRHWPGLVESTPTLGNDSLASGKLIRETLSMFPNRIRAIRQDDQGLKLILSETDDVPVSTPIYVRICDGQQCAAFVTFSGQEIQVAGQTVTVLADPRGGIIVTGNQFVWSNTAQTHAGDRLKIEAKSLEMVAM